MIQFNLLPDVKLEYIKTRRTKHLLTMICTGLVVASLVVFIGLFTIVNVLQKKHLSDLNSDISKNTATLKAIPDLNKVLTIQNQLSSLTSLHQKTPAGSRLFGYLAQVTPAQATISDVKVDFKGGTLTLSGNADALSTVNQFVDTLKFTTYKVDGSKDSPKAFSNVVLTSFSKDDKNASYQIDMKFDPVIFDNTKSVKLTVPKIISTRSETEKPSDLFQALQPVKQQGQ
jgi:Tfp pilus assembly protein PilN